MAEEPARLKREAAQARSEIEATVSELRQRREEAKLRFHETAHDAKKWLAIAGGIVAAGAVAAIVRRARDE